MARSSLRIDENTLTKGQLRKLNALRKSIGDDLGSKTFAEWLAEQGKAEPKAPTDRNAKRIQKALLPLVLEGKLSIPRGGYLLRRGRRRVIVERPNER